MKVTSVTFGGLSCVYAIPGSRRTEAMSVSGPNLEKFPIIPLGCFQ